jgi:hypothetical protein
MTRVSERNNFICLSVFLVVLLVASLADQFSIPQGQYLAQALRVLTLACGVIGLQNLRLL